MHHASCIDRPRFPFSLRLTHTLARLIYLFYRFQYLPLGLLTAMTLGVLFPHPGAAAAKMGLGKLSMTGIFILSGLALRVTDVKSAVSDYKPILFGLLFILGVAPYTGATIALATPHTPKVR